MRRTVLITVVLALIAGAAVWSQTNVDPQLAQPKPPSNPWLSYITNWPASQTVDGTVNVGNLPATQEVSGTVSVNNLPACPGAAALVFVGFTAATFDGGAGPLGMSRGCAAEFGDGARMGTFAEILATPNPPAMTPGTVAWAIHTFEDPDTCQSGASNNGGSIVEASGVGRIGARSCNELLPVACVAPVQ